MLQSKEGHRIPKVTFPVRQNDAWVTLNSTDLFAGKNVVVFALPGAFTPTCSSTHLPRYNELAGAFKDNGVDEIVCISVNDTFVMNAWLADQEADNITVVPDGNGEFTEAMGMLVDKSELGFGQRSWRYSMLVKDSVIEKMFIEPEKPGDPFEVSDADTMLAYINPKARPPQSIALFTKPGCPYCAAAKAMLRERDLAFEEISLGSEVSLMSLRAVTGETSVPQVFVDGQRIGGSEALKAYLD